MRALGGLLALILWAGWDTPTWAMDVHVEGDRLVMSGSVDGQDYDRFIKLVNGAQVVELRDSHGGDLEAAFNVGREIRRRGLMTVARGYCRSSCALMFLGGVVRRLASERSCVALHSGYKPHIDYPSGEWVGLVLKFYGEMIPQLPEDLLQTIMNRPRGGYVYFFNQVVYVCDGTEASRPFGCAKLGVMAVEAGVITEGG